MEYIRSLQSELMKTKGSRILLITVCGGLLVSVMFMLRFLIIEYHINLRTNGAAWERLFSQNARAFVGFIAPIGAMLICVLVTQIEYRNNNWKQVHTSPQRLSTIFFAKFSVILMLTMLVFVVLNIGVVLHGVIPCLVHDASLPDFPIPWRYFFTETLKCFVFTLPIIAFQYLLSLHFKNFMVAIGAGLTVYVGSMPGVKLGAISALSPYSYVLQYFDETTTIIHVWMAIGYFVVLLLLSYFLYVNKAEKG